MLFSLIKLNDIIFIIFILHLYVPSVVDVTLSYFLSSITVIHILKVAVKYNYNPLSYSLLFPAPTVLSATLLTVCHF